MFKGEVSVSSNLDTVNIELNVPYLDIIGNGSGQTHHLAFFGHAAGKISGERNRWWSALRIIG